MATTILVFSLISTIIFVSCLALPPKQPFDITRGSSLTPENISSCFSPSGLYAFRFYQQGNNYRPGIFIAKIPEKTGVWTANRDNPPFNGDSILLLTRDGKLIVRLPHGEDMAIIETSEPIYSASMLDSGNFVLYKYALEVIWQSFSNPKDTILPGQSLKTDQKLISSISKNDYSTGRFCLFMQSDGNSVQYPVENAYGDAYSYWASNTYATGGNSSLNLDNSGNLYIPNSSTNMKNLTQGVNLKKEQFFMMKIDVDGILRL